MPADGEVALVWRITNRRRRMDHQDAPTSRLRAPAQSMHAVGSVAHLLQQAFARNRREHAWLAGHAGGNSGRRHAICFILLHHSLMDVIV